MYKKILVGVDGSATALRGLDEAVRVAKATGGRLMLVHVVNGLVLGADYPLSAGYYQALLESLRESGAKLLERAAAVVRRADVPCEQKVIETLGGRAADEIVKEASAWQADLIALGTHGRRGLKRLAMGSDAELVLRMSRVPVLLVRDQPEAL
jgi:nucleotide-binding universal stress UspA family protein